MPVPEMFRLDDRVGIVTGAGSGLGAAFAVALAEAGADVVLAARRPEKLHATARAVDAVGRRSLVVPTDVADPDQCAALAERAMSELGGSTSWSTTPASARRCRLSGKGRRSSVGCSTST
jgi:NAD(P)-dependent dehydrogenase (short-subunit alcohol dehydrogenase family)